MLNAHFKRWCVSTFLSRNTISTIHGHKAKFTLVIILTITFSFCYLGMVFSRMNSAKRSWRKSDVYLRPLAGCWLASCRCWSARPARTPRTPRSSTSGTCTCTAPSAAPAASCSRGCSTAGRSRRYPSSSETLAQFYNKFIKFVSLFQIIDILLSTGW